MTIDLESIFGEPSQARVTVPIVEAPSPMAAPVAEPATPPGMEAPVLGADGWPVDTIDPGGPCPACGSLERWWSIDGNEHCRRCEADVLNRSHKLAARAAGLRAA